MEQQLSKLQRFCGKNLMNIPISKKQLTKLIEGGLLRSAADIFELPYRKEECLSIRCINERSYVAMTNRIAELVNQPLEKLIFSLDIPGVTKFGARVLALDCGCSASVFEEKVLFEKEFPTAKFFSALEQNKVFEWFQKPQNYYEWSALNSRIQITTPDPEELIKRNVFLNRTVVYTGLFRIGRDDLEHKLRNGGADVQRSVTKNTDVLIIGSKPGPKKVSDADKYGIMQMPQALFWAWDSSL